jgi:sulfur carrier protein
MIMANGAPMEWREGLTVQESLESIGYALPMVIAQIDGRFIPRDEWASTPVPDGAEVSVIVMISGG